jgi:hypothetical protein
MKQKPKRRKRKHTTATKVKLPVMDVNCMTQSHTAGQAVEGHSIKGLGKKQKGAGAF